MCCSMVVFRSAKERCFSRREENANLILLYCMLAPKPGRKSSFAPRKNVLSRSERRLSHAATPGTVRLLQVCAPPRPRYGARRSAKSFFSPCEENSNLILLYCILAPKPGTRCSRKSSFAPRKNVLSRSERRLSHSATPGTVRLLQVCAPPRPRYGARRSAKSFFHPAKRIQISFYLLHTCAQARDTLLEKVVFRSAKERSFAERKTTFSLGHPGNRPSVAGVCHATEPAAPRKAFFTLRREFKLDFALLHTCAEARDTLLEKVVFRSAKERSFAERKTTFPRGHPPREPSVCCRCVCHPGHATEPAAPRKAFFTPRRESKFDFTCCILALRPGTRSFAERKTTFPRSATP